LQNFTKNIDVKFSKVSEITENENIWKVNNCFAKNVILSTGAFPQILQEPYLKIRPVWGERLDISSNSILKESFHKDISISQTVQGKIRIGATHFRNILERTADEVERENLILEAKNMVNLESVKILKIYSGVRSASFDYFPIFGKMVDSNKTIAKLPQIINGRKYPNSEYHYYKNLHIFSGLGGYGFSIAPYLANLFSENIEIPNSVKPHRFFSRWVKKVKNER